MNAPVSRGRRRWRNAKELPLGSNIPLPVGLQVVVAVGSLTVLFVAAILLAIFLVLELTSHNRQLSVHEVPYATAVDEASLAAKGAANDSRGFLISGRELYIEEFGRRVDETRAALATASAHATSQHEAELTQLARSRFARWVRATRREFDAYSSGQRQQALQASVGPNRALRKEYEAALTAARGVAENEIRVAERSYTGASHQAVTVLLLCLLAALALGLAVTIWVVRTILRPVYVVLELFAGLKAPPPTGTDVETASSAG
jgi:methyl-accepting chemotaxis protein